MNTDKTFYDNNQSLLSNKNEYYKAIKKIERYYNFYKHKFSENSFIKNDLTVLEMGAGSCTLSLLLSKLKQVITIYSLDISKKKMEECIPVTNEIIKGSPEKLNLIESDFKDNLPFQNEQIDLILFDASLHHTRSIWHTLEECNRVLKAGGLLIAQREQYVSPLRISKKMDSLMDTEEVKNGVSENAYLKEQYEYYLKVCGFSVNFIAAPETNFQSFFSFLNGYVFDKWIIIGEKC